VQASSKEALVNLATNLNAQKEKLRKQQLVKKYMTLV
jgi:hypothetical protein